MNPFLNDDWWRGISFVTSVWIGSDLMRDGKYTLGGLCLGFAMHWIIQQYKSGRRK